MLKAFSRSLFVLCFLLAAPAMLRAEEPRPDWPFPEGDFAPLFPSLLKRGRRITSPIFKRGTAPGATREKGRFSRFGTAGS